jgi:hypothetical protein
MPVKIMQNSLRPTPTSASSDVVVLAPKRDVLRLNLVRVLSILIFVPLGSST